VPILLGSFALLEHVRDAPRIYLIVFVVVAFSVLVQGTSMPLVARRLGVPMRAVEPRGLHRLVVEPGSRAAARAIGQLPLGERTWVETVVRDGQPLRVGGRLVLEPGDEVCAVVSDVADLAALDRLFAGGGEPG
jgi:cell volume regulation protein A